MAIAAWAEVTNTSGNITATERASVAVTFDSILDMVMGAAEATAWVKVGTPEAVSEPEEQAQARNKGILPFPADEAQVRLFSRTM
jgi:hypothetical protein